LVIDYKKSDHQGELAQIMKMILRRLQSSALASAVLCCGFAASISTGLAADPGKVAASPDLSGVWELRYDSLSTPEAALTPAAARNAKSKRRLDVESRRWCRVGGLPFLMLEAPLLNVVQGRVEVLISPQVQAQARHIYTDGVERADPEDFDAATNGYSVAHWEGNELVVRTKGFSDLGITAIPGGGYRTAKSQLIERFRLLDGGHRLSVASTWTDPDVFTRPHTYEVRYYRADAGTTASPQACDPFEPGRAEFFAPALR
jgi:hypothetical protein